MRSLSDYLDDFLYNLRLRKNAEKYGYTVYNAATAKKDCARLAPEVSRLTKELETLTRTLDSFYELRSELDKKIDKDIQEYVSKNGEDYRREDFFTAEYRILTEKIRETEDSRSRTETSLIEKKDRLKKAEDMRSAEDYAADFDRVYKKPAIVLVCFMINAAHLLFLLIRFLLMAKTLHTDYIGTNPLYYAFWMIFPIAVFIWSTCYAEWRFENRKLGALRFVIFDILAHVSILVDCLIYKLIAPIIFIAKPTAVFSKGDIVNTARFFIVLIFIVIVGVSNFICLSYINQPEIRESILYFKFSRGKDFRKDTEHTYDLKIVRRLKNASTYVIKETDRFLHFAVEGATGTGKTATILMQMFVSDLHQAVKNLNEQKMIAAHLLKDGKIKKLRPFSDRDFSINYFAPADDLSPAEREEIAKKLSDTKTKMPIAGQLVMSPGESMADDCYDIAAASDIGSIYRLDPMRTADGRKKPGWIGFNPLYISPLTTGLSRFDEITVRATVVKDTLNNLQKSSGKTDAYFEGVNSVQTTTVCVLLMLTFEDLSEQHRQPTLIDVQRLLNDFTEIRPYYYMLIRKFGNGGKPFPENTNGLELIDPRKVDLSLDAKQHAASVERFFKANKIDCGPWHHIFVTVRDTLLHPTEGPVQFDRARGLRDQYNLFLSDQRIRDIYNSDRVMDLDEVLLNGGIIIFNFALELGQETSRAFGTFFLILYSKAVLRRNPKSPLIPFFSYIDEFPTLIDKNLEELFSLHRQYHAANTIAFQNLDQMDRTAETRYFKDIILSNCAHKIIFGRVTPKEAKVYSDMSGTRYENTEQLTVSETPLLSDNPSVSYSSRSTLTRVPEITPSEFTYRDFKEATLYTVCDGDPLRPFAIKTEFVLKSEKKSLPRITMDWDMYPPRLSDTQPFFDVYPREPRARIYGQTPIFAMPQPVSSVYARESVKNDTGEYSAMMFGCGRTEIRKPPEIKDCRGPEEDRYSEAAGRNNANTAPADMYSSSEKPKPSPSGTSGPESHLDAFDSWFNEE